MCACLYVTTVACSVRMFVCICQEEEDDDEEGRTRRTRTRRRRKQQTKTEAYSSHRLLSVYPLSGFMLKKRLICQ